MKLVSQLLLLTFIAVTVSCDHGWYQNTRDDLGKDLKVVGAGHLGVRLGLLWQARFPNAKIYLKTHSDKPERSEKWRLAGFIPLSTTEDDDTVADYVVFCAPPTYNPNYDQDVKHAATVDWTGKGQFVFTGSGSVYLANDGSEIDEQSPVKDTERAHLLLAAEKATKDAGGIVIRFGGMFTRDSGMQRVYLKSGTEIFQSSPDGLFNLQHYDDAAGATMAALLASKASQDGELYLVSDGRPITRLEICFDSLACPDYNDCRIPMFTGHGVDGHKYNTSKFNHHTNWKPKFPFQYFMEVLYDQEMDCKDLFC